LWFFFPQKTRLSLVLLFYSLLFLGGCLSLPQGVSSLECERGFREASSPAPVAFFAEIRAQGAGNTGFLGEGTLLVFAPDKLRLDIFSPLGSMEAIVVGNGEAISLALPTAQRFYRGRATRARMERALLLPLTPQEIVGILRHDPQMLILGWRLLHCIVREGSAEYIFTKGGEIRRIFLDKEKRLIRFVGEDGVARFAIEFRYREGNLQELHIEREDGVLIIEISRQQATALSEDTFNLVPAPSMRVVEMIF